MHTKDMLAAELRKIGLNDLADEAATGYYHDYLSPLATPCVVLVSRLAAIGTAEAMGLRARVINGEFDASDAEAEEWAKGPEGQAVFRKLQR